MLIFLSFTLFVLANAVSKYDHNECEDVDLNCATWVTTNSSSDACLEDNNVKKLCRRMCEICGGPIDPRFDVRLLPSQLAPIGFLVGKWRSEFGGKAFFPTIPKFTYGEQVEFAISEMITGRGPSLNYTAFAWDANEDNIELHAENGYLAVNNSDTENPTIYMNTAMSNGFMTIEEGSISSSHQINFRLNRIGRISFSHDSAVRVMFRDWTLLDATHLEARLHMTTTVTRKLMEHTAIVYKRIYP